MNLIINNDVNELLEQYSSFCYEVGGILFGKKIFNHYCINHITFKKGSLLSISFLSDDKKIFYSNIRSKILGSWHYHPNGLSNLPSSIDLNQYQKWNHKYVHIILSNEGYKVFNNKGVVLYEKKF